MKEYRDFYFRKAKAENYPARSVYKLKEIDAKFHILKPGMKILDLGAAPGSWSMACAEKVGSNGLIIACDIQPLEIPLPDQVRFMQEDVFNISPAFSQLLTDTGPFDAVLSDMAPATTGSKFTDQARSFNLAQAAYQIALERLKTGGKFVVKIFMGPDINSLVNEMRAAFGQAGIFKPKSSRSESKEIFLAGLDFRGEKQ